jgi:hypothetical protein
MEQNSVCLLFLVTLSFPSPQANIYVFIGVAFFFPFLPCFVLVKWNRGTISRLYRIFLSDEECAVMSYYLQ